MTILLLLATFVIALLSTRWIYPWLLKLAISKELVDGYDGRKLQQTPVPVLGGWAIFFGICLSAGCAVAYGNLMLPPLVLIVLLVMLYIGTLDDVLHLSCKMRLLIETTCLLLFMALSNESINHFFGLWGGIGQLTSWISVPLTLFFCVGLINAINFIDGIDGLCSGFCFIASAIFGILFFYIDFIAWGILAIACCGAIIPFFVYNVFGSKRKMYLGNGGTLLLGMLMALFTIRLQQSDVGISLWTQKGVGVIPLILAIFFVPLFDGVRVIAGRFIRGKSPFLPDRTHFHHLLVDTNCSHWVATLCILALNLLALAGYGLLCLYGASVAWQLSGVLSMGILFLLIPHAKIVFKMMNKTRSVKKHTAMVGSALHLSCAIGLCCLLLLASSCGSVKKIRYFQDVDSLTEEQTPLIRPIALSIGDRISVIVSGRDPELTQPFNLFSDDYRYGNSYNNRNSTMLMPGYTVDSHGCITIPVLGTVRVAGMNKEEVSAFVQNELIRRDLLKDAVVTVEYLNLSVTVLGEVVAPGRIYIDKDGFTLLEALSMVGDLTIQGNREHIVVLRTEAGKQVPYLVNLCSVRDVYASPVYYLQQNDVIYVEPNSMRARQSTVNGNNMQSVSFWMSLTSFVTTLFFTIFR